MDDEKIIQLYFARDENALTETAAKYGRLCSRIASNILSSREDCEECVNDTYLTLWNTIPPQRPSKLSAFTGRITRNLSLKKLEYSTAAKRNPEAVCSLEELNNCVSGRDTPESELEGKRVETAISDFLWRQSKIKRCIFVRRYWYFESIDSICLKTGYSRSKVTSMLHNLRQKLRKHLESEGITI